MAKARGSWFLLGFVLGIATGVLVAPRRGRETRELVADKAGEGIEYLRVRSEPGSTYLRRRLDDFPQILRADIAGRLPGDVGTDSD